MQEEGGDDESWSQREVMRPAARALDFYHLSLYYSDFEVIDGWVSTDEVTRPLVRTGLPQEQIVTKLSITNTGLLKWGYAADCPCSCADKAQIVDCLRNRAEPTSGMSAKTHRMIGNNCQTDIKYAMSGCCLEGWEPQGIFNAPYWRNYDGPPTWRRKDGSPAWSQPTPWKNGDAVQFP